MASLLNTSCGSYDLLAHEYASNNGYKKQIRSVKCRIYFLDDNEYTFDIEKGAIGQILLAQVYEYLELVEKEYFGLQYVDTDRDNGNTLMRWLDNLKPIRRQITGIPPYILFFRVKFYISDPSKLRDEYTRYHFYLQIKRDILEGKFTLPQNTAAMLAGYAVQSELGDFNVTDHGPGYLSVFRFIPKQTEQFELEVSEWHKQFRLQTPADAEYNYIDIARKQEMYGIELHNAQFKDGDELQISISSIGVSIYKNGFKTNTYLWSKISKISFKRKIFILDFKPEANGPVQCSYILGSYRLCKNLWKLCIEHHAFFRLHSVRQVKPGLFFFQSRFRYSGRTEFETLEDARRKTRVSRMFQRTPSKKYARRTIATFNDLRTDGNRQNPKNTRVNGISPSYSNSNQTRTDYSSLNSNQSTALNSLAESSITQLTQPIRNQRNVSSTTHEKIMQKKNLSTSQFSNTDQRSRLNNAEFRIGSTHNLEMGRVREGEGSVNNRYGSLRVKGTRSSSAAGPRIQSTVIKSNFPMRSISVERNNQNKNRPKSSYFGFQEGQLNSNHLTLSNHSLNEEVLVTIAMSPDLQGRFGFNIRGGVDLNSPIIVSKVATNSPADLCNPRLNEGDQILFVNGRDISKCTHEQVINMCRSNRLQKQLVLVIKPNAVYIADDLPSEETDSNLPKSLSPLSFDSATNNNIKDVDPLAKSIRLLVENLRSGKAVELFERLHRKNPHMSSEVAYLPENVDLNRYRDIAPYDITRVKIRKTASEYINANFVTMEISPRQSNFYIATQGPLPRTSASFWQMVWEQNTSIIVMLTLLIERGRTKCHQYWPENCRNYTYGKVNVSSVVEEKNSAFIFRDFIIKHLDHPGDERRIRHMQYMTWPDHGVPNDPTEFITFILMLKKLRQPSHGPLIVHCSAGIGRTGVSVLMETALCLMEIGQPIRPIEIVQKMRDQRAMMVQTPGQFVFVCEAIIKAYEERILHLKQNNSPYHSYS